MYILYMYMHYDRGWSDELSRSQVRIAGEDASGAGWALVRRILTGGRSLANNNCRRLSNAINDVRIVNV